MTTQQMDFFSSLLLIPERDDLRLQPVEDYALQEPGVAHLRLVEAECLHREKGYGRAGYYEVFPALLELQYLFAFAQRHRRDAPEYGGCALNLQRIVVYPGPVVLLELLVSGGGARFGGRPA